jgi:hypothetical protein
VTYQRGTWTDREQVIGRVQAITYASSITPSMLYNVFNVGTLTNGITINAPTDTPADGHPFRFRFTQDSGGSHSITWNSVFVFSSDFSGSDIATTASKSVEVGGSYHSSSGKYRITGKTGTFT